MLSFGRGERGEVTRAVRLGDGPLSGEDASLKGVELSVLSRRLRSFKASFECWVRSSRALARPSESNFTSLSSETHSSHLP